jgi:hypothetical protein
MMNDLDSQTILIPHEPCPWQEDIYVGKEVEFTPVGCRGAGRAEFAGTFVRQLAQVIPSRPHSPDTLCDFFTPLGRVYQEMSEFLELGGPTCRSGEAVAWAYEASLMAMSRVVVGGNGQAVVLCHTPSDYNNRPSSGGHAHSTGCHFNMLLPRSLGIDEICMLAGLTSPLNAVFGPGGLTWSGDGRMKFCCDPRADHVSRLAGSAAHGGPKPFFLFRDEPHASAPYERLQCVAFGSPRSPLSSWLQAELLPLALRAVLAHRSPPWYVENPLQALRASPHEPVTLKQGRPGRDQSMSKAELAAATVQWLTEFAAGCALGPNVADRMARIRHLGVEAAVNSAAAGTHLPVFSTDIAIKRTLLDRTAQTRGFAGLHDVACAIARAPADKNIRGTVDAMIVADVLFSSPSQKHSTYELAAQSGLFTRPQFEQPIDLCNLAHLPAGIARRDRVRASLLAGSDRGRGICFCDWDHLCMNDGTTIRLSDPWSDLNDIPQ